MWEWMYRSTFLDLGTTWRWVVNFTPRPLYPRGKSPRYPLDRRLGGTQSRSGRFGEQNILWPCQDSNSDPSIVQPVAGSYTDWAIPAPLCITTMREYCFVIEMTQFSEEVNISHSYSSVSLVLSLACCPKIYHLFFVLAVIFDYTYNGIKFIILVCLI
jgi:hypothetical protein